MDSKNRAELEQKAQALLVEARNLIKEAGKLAKEGQFVLHVGETGTFIPKRYKDPELYREEALQLLQADGWSRWDPLTNKTVVTPWDTLSDAEKESAVESEIESIIDDLAVPYEYREYGGDEGTDSWWKPSRC